MRPLVFSYYSGPLVALGALVAVVCLAGSWYINRLQADLAQAVRQDAAGMEAAVDLQVQLRHLRVHTVVLVADHSKARREVVMADVARVESALGAVRQTTVTAEKALLADKILRDYAQYRDKLGLDRLPSPTSPLRELARWSDAIPAPNGAPHLNGSKHSLFFHGTQSRD